MAKPLPPDRELEQIRRERERLAAQSAELEVREQQARVALQKRSNELLVDAFAKGRFGIVAKAQATELSKRVSTIGIDAVLERLAS